MGWLRGQARGGTHRLQHSADSLEGFICGVVGYLLRVAGDRAVLMRCLCGGKGRHDLVLCGRGGVFESLVVRGECVDVEPRVGVGALVRQPLC